LAAVEPAEPLQRHFLAVRPDGPALQALMAIDLPQDARRVHPDDLHLTLAFLGSLDEAGEARALRAAATALPADLPAIVLGSVEHWVRARVLCAAGGTGEHDLLAPVAARLAAALAANGFEPPDKPFRSHVTLARVPRRAQTPARALTEPIQWRAGEIVLLASRVSPVRPRYLIRGRLPLTHG
jgi:2'-5' RNA ligase